MHNVFDVAPLLGLTQLQDLQIDDWVTPQQLRQLAVAIGPTLTSISLSQVLPTQCDTEWWGADEVLLETLDVAKTILSEHSDGTLPPRHKFVFH